MGQGDSTRWMLDMEASVQVEEYMEAEEYAKITANMVLHMEEGM